MMNTFYKTALAALAAVAAVGCTEDAIDPLTGKYPVPAEYTLTTLSDQSTEKLDNGLRLFTVAASSSDGTLTAHFTADKYYLVGQTYTYAAAAGTSGTYCNTTWTPSGSSAKAVTSGDIKVTADGDSYALSGALTLEDGSVIRVSFSGTIVYEEVIEATVLSNLLSAGISTVNSDGSYLITVKVGTTGTTATVGLYGTTVGGTGQYASIDFVSASASLDEGVYTPAASGSTTVGNFVMGYDTEFWGYTYTNWGSCWFTVESDVSTGTHIETGTVTVTKDGGVTTITIQNDDIYAQYTGELGL